jgi:YegS/Rv2252/BmrU family lipid kinase
MTQPAPPRRALLIVNERSRQGAEAAEAAAALLAGHGLQLLRERPPEGEGLDTTIRRHAGAVDLVVLGGGDGTLNAAAPALRDTGLPLGILPLGTANDLARTLGIPTDLADAARVVAEGRVRRIDLGEVNGRPFFNVASIGLSVAMTRELTGGLKRRWGRLGYALATFRALARLRPFRAEIRHDGQVLRVRTIQVSVGNGRHYGGGMTVDEAAAIDDGLLHLYSVEVASLWKLALIYPAFRAGRHGMLREVRSIAAPEFVLRTRRQRRVNTDGEITTRTPARFRVLRDALAVIVPAETAAADVPGLSRP